MPDKDINDILVPPPNISLDEAIAAMEAGEVEIHGLMPWGSNYTFLGTLRTDDLIFNVIYKPQQGERAFMGFCGRVFVSARGSQLYC